MAGLRSHPGEREVTAACRPSLAFAVLAGLQAGSDVSVVITVRKVLRSATAVRQAFALLRAKAKSAPNPGTEAIGTEGVATETGP